MTFREQPNLGSQQPIVDQPTPPTSSNSYAHSCLGLQQASQQTALSVCQAMGPQDSSNRLFHLSVRAVAATRSQHAQQQQQQHQHRSPAHTANYQSSSAAGAAEADAADAGQGVQVPGRLTAAPNTAGHLRRPQTERGRCEVRSRAHRLQRGH